MRVYNQKESLFFTFKQTPKSFFVEELPTFKWDKKGKYCIIKVQKRALSTWEMLQIFCDYLGIKEREIGYAGLKDKHATTIQYLTFSTKYLKKLKQFSHKQIKILSTKYTQKALRIGDLEGNFFRITLFDVSPIVAGKIEKRARRLLKSGVPNYFGHQRFGRGDALIKAKEFVEAKSFVKDKKLQKFYTSIYQSDLFNKWLSYRVEKNLLEPLEGDVFKDGIFTGLLPGRAVQRATKDARAIEKRFDDPFIATKGDRRAALFFPKSLQMRYNKEAKEFTLEFVLPKGSYATVFIEALKAEENFTNS